jgi:hypothetical protein
VCVCVCVCDWQLCSFVGMAYLLHRASHVQQSKVHFLLPFPMGQLRILLGIPTNNLFQCTNAFIYHHNTSTGSLQCIVSFASGEDTEIKTLFLLLSSFGPLYL